MKHIFFESFFFHHYQPLFKKQHYERGHFSFESLMVEFFTIGPIVLKTCNVGIQSL